MEKLAVYNSMSFNKKRVPQLEELMETHASLGDSYLNQFGSCDALVGSPESIEYLDRFFATKGPDTVSQVLSLLIEAKELLLNRGSSKYMEDFNDLQKVINSITNKQ
ncbi:hypothetical protein UFOVP972_37 [uncultured Caudovirales phage]|uniref:Uncharacterized protein n=1 Tax=uncultured Caudovirales phage TaxID=2100421 RepID=A0A6J5PYW6_9CAUD|nr:hypothetical protein UFOVP972_37 [uncultured Caudovirales phage]